MMVTYCNSRHLSVVLTNCGCRIGHPPAMACGITDGYSPGVLAGRGGTTALFDLPVANGAARTAGPELTDLHDFRPGGRYPRGQDSSALPSLNRLIARRLESDKSASISRLRGVIRGRRPNQSSIGRITAGELFHRTVRAHYQRHRQLDGGSVRLGHVRTWGEVV